MLLRPSQRWPSASHLAMRLRAWLERPALDGTDADLGLAIKLASEVRYTLLGPARHEVPISELESRLLTHRIGVRQARLWPDKGGPQALLIPKDGDGFDISVDPTPPGGWGNIDPDLRRTLGRHRSRFLIAHELAHSFFFDRTPRERPQRRQPSDPLEERFCDEFARWFLLPIGMVRRQPATAESVFHLHRTFDVSVQLAARALTEVYKDQSWITIAIRRPTSGVDLWRLQWSSALSPLRTDEALERQLTGSSNPTCQCERADTTSAYDDRRRQLVLAGRRRPDYCSRASHKVSATSSNADRTAENVVTGRLPLRASITAAKSSCAPSSPRLRS